MAGRKKSSKKNSSARPSVAKKKSAKKKLSAKKQIGAKKKAGAKKKISKKKKSAVTNKTSVHKKITTKKKPTAKKKTAVKKSGLISRSNTESRDFAKSVKQKSSTPKAVPREQPPSAPRLKKAGATSAERSVEKSPVSKKGGALTTGRRIRIISGQYVGKIGKIISQDPYLGTFLITLDEHKNDPAYKAVEWGPFFASQLETV